jgi:hypothetical protein
LATDASDFNRGDVIERPWIGRNGDLRRIMAAVDVVGELGIPVAKAVRAAALATAGTGTAAVSASAACCSLSLSSICYLAEFMLRRV